MHTPKGSGVAHFLIDYGMENDLLWVIALDNGGQIWCLPNQQVRLYQNESIGRKKEERNE
jgi:hypothetical protein